MNVLIAVDGPEFGKIISDFVCNYRFPPRTAFRVITVVDTPRAASASQEPEIAVARALVRNIAQRIADTFPGSDVRDAVIYGLPAQEILDLSDEWPAHLIVVGSHGRRAIGRFVMGSVSTAVVLHAHCSVVVVRLPVAGAREQELRKTAVRGAISHVTP